MENPFRSEQAAFRLLWITVGAFALIAIAAIISTWLGVATFVVLTAAAIVYYLRARGPRTEQQHVEHRGSPTEQRVVVVADDVPSGNELAGRLHGLARGRRQEVLVVTPALNDKVHQWSSDVDSARGEAHERMERSLQALSAAGVEATGHVGAADPAQALDDAVRTFGADEIVFVTPSAGTHWHEQGVVEAARARYDVPVHEVVVAGAQPG